MTNNPPDLQKNPGTPGNPGTFLADLTWLEAEKLLTPNCIVMIPLGAGAKEHGPHLRLDNDLQMADYLAQRVIEKASVIVAPTINYHYYPAFLEYPGSTHLRFETARDLLIDIIQGIAAHGPRRFYILNTGVSTQRPLRAAQEILQQEGIIMHFTDILEVAKEEEEQLRLQTCGTHADELETSMMLYITPDRVDMSKAVCEDNPHGNGGLTRNKNNPGTYSASGTWGDATLATYDKGKIIIEATVRDVLKEIEVLAGIELS